MRPTPVNRSVKPKELPPPSKLNEKSELQKSNTAVSKVIQQHKAKENKDKDKDKEKDKDKDKEK